MTAEMQALVDEVRAQIASFRGAFEAAMEFGDFDRMEDAFNGVAQIAWTVNTFDKPEVPAADPTRINGYALAEYEMG